MAYNLGIDIGIASVGFAGINLGNKNILFCGAHIFEAAENPKTGASLATPRRTKRGMRRVIHRRAVRKKAIRSLLAGHGLKDIEAIDAPEAAPPGKTVWELRKEALERKLTDAEFSRVLFHIAKSRGFQSNRKSAEPNDTEGKKALSGAKELQEAMTRANASTVGAYLAALPKKRNGDGSYERFVTRDLLREEIRKIFTAQRKFGNENASDKLQKEYAETAFYQRPLQSSEHLVGDCYLTGEKRAPKFSYTAELFILWSKLNNAKIRDMKGNERFLTQDEKNRLAEKAHALKSVSYKQARKELDLPDEERFNIGYRKIKDEDNSWGKIRDAAEKSDFLKLPGYHALKSALETGSSADWQKWAGKDRDKLDEIARVLSFYEDPKQIDEMLTTLELDKEQIKNLSTITNFSKTVDLSLKAIGDILPHMRTGMTYDKACKEAGYDHSRKENKGLGKVPPFDDIRNPVVNRALAQTRKVINAIIREHDMPETIIIELARDVGRNFQDRKDIEREQKKNQSYREEAKTHIAEILGIIPDNVTGEDILKYRLWKEQDCFCPYSGTYITPEALRDSVATQIDHIIPYSRSWNDSYMNKVLCLTDENQNKRNDTPVEYFKRTGKNLDALTAFSRQLPPRKAENILIEDFDEEKAKKWKDRALNDTRYMARLLKNHLEQSLALGEGSRVQTRNGMLTAHLRGAWGFPDKDRRNDRHHALDAIVLACSTQKQVQDLANWNKYEARVKNPAERPYPPKPWDTFRDEAKAAVGRVFVSRMPVRKITGAAHEDTIRSIRKSDGKIIQRTKLTDLSLKTLEDLVDKNRNIKLYNLLKERLDQHGGKADKAFAEPIYMPTNDPLKQGPRINSVRVVTNEKSGIKINEGLASNGDMVRVDVFSKPNKKGKSEFYLCPIYVHHFARKELPNKVAVSGGNENEWVEIDSAFDFCFSVHKNDLIRVVKKDEELMGYFVDMNRNTVSISIRAHDNDPSFGNDGVRGSLGVKSLLAFERYSVDYFGNRHRIKKELRLGLAQRDDSESGETESVERTVAAGE